MDHGAAVRRAVDLALKVVDASFRPAMGQTSVCGWGLQSTEVAYLLLTQQPRVQFPAFQKKLRGKIIKVAEVNQRHWLEESGQWLENVY